MMPACPGDLKISGIYPDCKCDWICEEIVKTECTMASDCGRQDDVCSNGKCIAIPKIIETESEPEEIIIPEIEEPEITEEEEPFAEEKEEEPGVTEGAEPLATNVVFEFFQTLISKIRNPRITGYVVDEEGSCRQHRGT